MIDFSLPTVSEFIARKDKPLLVWGTGDGADKLFSAYFSDGTAPDGFFASKDFARGQLFRGQKVMSLEEAEEKFGDFRVLLAFGSSLPEVMENIEAVAKRHELIAPDLPVYGDGLFTKELYFEDESLINAARELFCDEASRLLFDNLISYKLSGDISFLNAVSAPCPLPDDYNAYIDIGAYRGDTLKSELARSPKIKKAAAFEPDSHSFSRLSDTCRQFGDIGFSLYPVAAGNPGMLPFRIGGARSSAPSATGVVKKREKLKTVESVAPDGLCLWKNDILLIKYDAEGAESEALDGSRALMENNLCDIALSVYHRPRELYTLTLKLANMLPGHRFFLRKPPYIPAWDVMLYAVSKR